jgi:hypothetical protein
MSYSKKSTINQKQKNYLGNTPIYEYPRYKEYENIPVEKFRLDKEKTQREYNQLQKDLINLKDDFIKTKERCKDRENELRQHINNLLLKYRTRDPQVNLRNMKELEEQIMHNIQTLEEQSKQDIREKKKDMENRIKLRLIDREINYNRELDKKVKEQQEILKALHEFTTDMQKITNNYNSIKDKAEYYLKENTMYKIEINDLEEKNEKLKSEIMKLKHMNNKMSIKLMNKGINEEDIDEMENNFSKNMKVKFENEQKEKFRNKMKEKAKRNTGIINENKSIKLNGNEVISIDKIVELLSDEDFVSKNYRECSVISNLLNIYEKTSKKINKLNNEYEKLIDRHPIYDRLVQLIQQLKSKEINTKIKSINQMSKRVINELLGNYIITMKKDQRKELIELLINDEEITNLIYNEKLPNIMNRDRVLGA